MIICLASNNKVIDANTIYMSPTTIGLSGMEYCIKYQLGDTKYGTVFKSSSSQEAKDKFNTFKKSVIKGEAIYSEYD